MINITGQGIRNDSKGQGHYRAKRGSRRHKGADYVCTPGQDVPAPISATIVREAIPYADDDRYSGVVLQGEHMRLKMFYLSPDRSLIGKKVKAGQVIGTAQDISQKYSPAMMPHIHLEIVEMDPELFVDKL